MYKKKLHIPNDESASWNIFIIKMFLKKLLFLQILKFLQNHHAHAIVFLTLNIIQIIYLTKKKTYLVLTELFTDRNTVSL